LNNFSSQDELKSYLSSGRRAADAGVFEDEKAKAADTASAVSAKEKNAAKTEKEAAIGVPDMAKFFSLGEKPADRAGDIIELSGSKIYFSPLNQFYWPASAIASRPPGKTKIFNLADPGGVEQVGTIAQDGNFMVLDGALAVFLNNSLAVYDISAADSAIELWRGRVNKDSRIVGSEFLNGKFYLTVKTEIDPANPCPIKPLSIKEKAAVVDCSAIRYPSAPLPADSIFTIFEINPRSGEVARDVSLVAAADFSLSLANGAIWAAWSYPADHIAFFADFLNVKCKGLLPNYILEKTSLLPKMEISRPAKEFELRGLFSEWFASLSKEEQTRIAGEITNRIEDYLRDRFGDFEQTFIAKIGLSDFPVLAQTQIGGRLAAADFGETGASGLRLIAVSGTGGAQNMQWFVSGKIGLNENEKTQNGIYLLDNELNQTAVARNLDIPAGICAARFGADNVYARVCRAGEPVYVLGFGAQSIGLRGKMPLPSDSTYFYPFGGDMALAIFPNGRKIKMALFDLSSSGRPEKTAEYDINDYWVDFEANAASFAYDAESGLLFIPGARGGHIFSRADGRLDFQKSVGSIAVQRAFFEGSNLYIAGDAGIEIFGGEDFAELNSVEF
jgi:uncharacterized secreted protein with C-terminal beta-propeller domain